MKQKPQKDMQKDPKPNPLWRRAPVRISPNGRSAWVDAMLLHDIAEHNRIFKVNEGGKR